MLRTQRIGLYGFRDREKGRIDRSHVQCRVSVEPVFTLVQRGHRRAALMVVLFAALRLGFNNLSGRKNCGSVSDLALFTVGVGLDSGRTWCE